jgi:mono/diheme cytochrome c family protein
LNTNIYIPSTPNRIEDTPLKRHQETSMKPILLSALFLASPLAMADSASDYATQCASCHGASGAGDGMDLPVKPANFQDAAFWSSRTDDQVKLVIKSGGAAAGKSPMMPPLGAGWSDAQLDAMVSYLKSFKK